MKVKIIYQRLFLNDWRPRMPARDVERLSRPRMDSRYSSSRGGVTQATVEIAGLDITTRVVCSAEDNFCRREGRARAIKSLVDKLGGNGLLRIAHPIAALYSDDLEWLLLKDKREAQEKADNAALKAQRDAENKAAGLARQAAKGGRLTND